MIRLCLLVTLFAGCGTPAPVKTEAAPVPVAAVAMDFTNEKGELLCPVTGEVMASKEEATSHVVYEGKDYYFCCDDCAEKFNADPAAYADGKAIVGGEAHGDCGGDCAAGEECGSHK